MWSLKITVATPTLSFCSAALCIVLLLTNQKHFLLTKSKYCLFSKHILIDIMIETTIRWGNEKKLLIHIILLKVHCIKVIKRYEYHLNLCRSSNDITALWVKMAKVQDIECMRQLKFQFLYVVKECHPLGLLAFESLSGPHYGQQTLNKIEITNKESFAGWKSIHLSGVKNILYLKS